MGDNGWQRLGRAVKKARVRAGYPRATDLASAAHLSRRTITLIESGTHPGHPRDTTLTAIEAALGWEDGHIDAILSGRRPGRGEDPVLARLRELWPRLTEDQRTSVLHLAENYVRRR